MFKKILIPVDDSRCSEQAARCGLGLAKTFNASVLMLHVLEALPEIYRDTSWAESLMQQARDLLADWEKKAQPEQIPMQTRVLQSQDIAQSIVQSAQETACDLIVMGTHGRKGLAHMFLGSVAERVTRLSDLPVMLIRDIKGTSDIKRIVVAIDGSMTSRKALQYADNLAQTMKAELHLLHVIPDLPPPLSDPLGIAGMVSGLTYESMLADLEREARIVMEVSKAEIKTQNPVLFTARAQRERVADVITRYAKEYDADLVVMGTHGRTGLNYMLLGSVAQGVAHQATVPLLLVHDQEKA